MDNTTIIVGALSFSIGTHIGIMYQQYQNRLREKQIQKHIEDLLNFWKPILYQLIPDVKSVPNSNPKCIIIAKGPSKTGKTTFLKLLESGKSLVLFNGDTINSRSGDHLVIDDADCYPWDELCDIPENLYIGLQSLDNVPKKFTENARIITSYRDCKEA